ncbi:serine/threonine-protein kinase [Acaryochloris sp. CCMEE 5410]|uniref:serine/threonine protein kinase n=1 Tax=Acaryochloris sp. CCMEE 5410 TaxID=310037 RepID=UPI00024846A5|nr:serine/threonine-protein kinase [Acaryochloris sp. CCMEE 5410]KAI9134306.1 serine/threonine protein kinase [Acaryochloris sp. CCMEE 5410]
MSNQIVRDGLRPGYVLQTVSNGHRYQIQQKLSDKAGRQTYLAQDSEQNEQVIIKILNFDDALTWDHFKLFEREAKTLQNLSHPAIPKYRDYLDLDSGDFKGFALVQTYIKAQSLESYLQAGCTFSEAEIKQLAESLLEILTYLHSQNSPVIHRDLKPSNILLGDRSGNHLGQVYLVDFGSVQTVASKESGTITIVGSYGYIPFEQFCGQAVPASDLYSLGMTLLYLATGVHPADLPQKQGEIQINNTGLSRPLEQWLKQMTSPRLDRRFPDAQSALKALIHHQAYHQTQLQPLYTRVQLRRIHETFEADCLTEVSQSLYFHSL